MSREIGILGVQIGMGEDKHDNLMRALAFIDDAFTKYKKIDIICLPELFYSNPTKTNRATIGEELDSEFFHEFSACAKKYHVNIITGSYPLIRGDKMVNACLCINREGELIGEYAKTHLFDAFSSKESDTCDFGDSLGIVDFDFGKVGIAICYELRFPEYLRTIALKGVDLMFIPSAFYRPRHDHWTTLVTSCALSNVIYTTAVNQYNDHFTGRSMIADPFGQIVAQASDRETSFFAVVDLDYQAECRGKLLSYENRRPELYDVK